MRRFDPDLIAALAEGFLGPDEAAAVERDIAADPAASAELAAQRAALSFLGSVEAPQLTASERTALSASVAAALGLDAPDAVTHHAPRRIPWGSLGIAAAALAGLVAIVPVVGLLSTGGSDAGSLDLAAEAPISTDDAARTALADAAVPEAAAAEELAAGDTGVSTFESNTTLLTQVAPGSETSLIEAPGPTTTVVTTTTKATTTTTATTSTVATTTTASEFDQLVAELTALHRDPIALKAISRAADSTSACWGQDTAIRPTPPPSRSVFDYSSGSYTVIVYYVLTGASPGPFQVWSVPSCESVAVVG